MIRSGESIECLDAAESVRRIRRVVFWGALGNARRYGGGECGNHRTIRTMEKVGLTVICCAKPYPWSTSVLRWPAYLVQLTWGVLATGMKCLATSADALHVSGFYGHLIFWEGALLLIGRLCGVRTTYEIRGGNAMVQYQQRGPLYRWFFRKAVRSADCVLCQGMVYMDFVKSLGANMVLYYPNYVESLTEPGDNGARPDDEVVRLLYFGRIDAAKRIDVAIRTAALLRQQGVPCSLTLIGSGENGYTGQCRVLARRLGLEDAVQWLPRMSGPQLMEELPRYHFFLYPTETALEGHSNAVTEAMANGVVPICHDQGFSRDIVGDAGVILKANSPEAFARAVSDIGLGDRWSERSIKCRRIVQDRYTSKQALACMRRAYCGISPD